MASPAGDDSGVTAAERLGLEERVDDDNFGIEEDSLGEDLNDDSVAGEEDPELEAIKARVKAMEEEAEKLKEIQREVEDQMMGSSPSATSPIGPLSVNERKEIDDRSIYVGNVDYGSTAEDLERHFHGCGSVNRVTILQNKFTGHPKGFAYIEFNDSTSVEMAKALDESLFRGRQIKVTLKRTNEPGYSTTNRPPRGRGRGGFRPRGPPRGGYGGGYDAYNQGGYYPRRPRGGRFRPRRTNWYSPY